MRVYYRTSRRSGISMGLWGTLAMLLLLGMYYLVVLAVAGIVLVVTGITLAVRAIHREIHNAHD